MRPNPKKPPIKLSATDYHLLRVKVWNKQLRSCYYCQKYVKFNEFSLHHKDTGGMGMKGDDTEDNVEGTCLACHPDQEAKMKVKCPRCGKVFKFTKKPKEIQCCVKFSVFEYKRLR